jgi:hypothetical protein
MPQQSETRVPDMKSIGYRFFNHRQFQLLASPCRGKTCCASLILYRPTLRSSAALWADDFSTVLQLKHKVFIVPLFPALNPSLEEFPPLSISFFFKTLLRRTFVQNVRQHIFLMMHNLPNYCQRAHCSTENIYNILWTALYETQQIRSHMPALTGLAYGSSNFYAAGKVIKDTPCICVWGSNKVLPFV